MLRSWLRVSRAWAQPSWAATCIDELHLVIVPILLGGGERLFDHLDGGPVGYDCVECVSSPSSVVPVRLSRVAPQAGPGDLA
jgi:hypothetical protein